MREVVPHERVARRDHLLEVGVHDVPGRAHGAERDRHDGRRGEDGPPMRRRRIVRARPSASLAKRLDARALGAHDDDRVRSGGAPSREAPGRPPAATVRNVAPQSSLTRASAPPARRARAVHRWRRVAPVRVRVQAGLHPLPAHAAVHGPDDVPPQPPGEDGRPARRRRRRRCLRTARALPGSARALRRASGGAPARPRSRPSPSPPRSRTGAAASGSPSGPARTSTSLPRLPSAGSGRTRRPRSRVARRRTRRRGGRRPDAERRGRRAAAPSSAPRRACGGRRRHGRPPSRARERRSGRR